jgi:hypothetical protein
VRRWSLGEATLPGDWPGAPARELPESSCGSSGAGSLDRGAADPRPLTFGSDFRSGHHCCRENPRTGPGGCPGGTGSGSSESGSRHSVPRSRKPAIRFFGTGRSAGLETPEWPERLGLVEFGFKRHEGWEPGNRFHSRPAVSSERRKAHESSGRGGPRFAAVRISTESKALELRGIVTSWSSEQEHAMSKTT